MSRYIAKAAIRGANLIVNEAEQMVESAIADLGADTPVAFTNTAYYLPVILGFTGMEANTLGHLQKVLVHAKSLLSAPPFESLWLPYLGETLDGGAATLLAMEAIEAVRFVRGQQPDRIPGLQLTGTSFTNPDGNGGGGAGYANGPIDDIQLRAWGIQLVDGRMPGFAAIVGAARTNEAAVAIVRELQKRNILVFLSGNVNGRSIIHQLMEEGVEMGYDTYIVPFGTDTISAIYALGFATRSALTFGGMSGGQTRDILLYNKFRVFAFVLALGEVDDLKYAAAAGAINYGFPVIADTLIPQILPTGVTPYEHVISMPFDDIEGATDDREGAPPRATLHRGARRQDQDHRGAYPGALWQRLRRGAGTPRRHARGVRRAESPSLRVSADGRTGRDRGRTDPGRRARLSTRSPRAEP